MLVPKEQTSLKIPKYPLSSLIIPKTYNENEESNHITKADDALRGYDSSAVALVDSALQRRELGGIVVSAFGALSRETAVLLSST